jgi:CO/xanthine dehydrogenase Mo-binding subunit
MIIGEALSRKDAWTKANGISNYSFDIHFPNEEYIAVIRSPYPHAKINSIQIDREKIRELNATVGTCKEIPMRDLNMPNGFLGGLPRPFLW